MGTGVKMMAAPASKVLAVARGQLGQTEQPPGSNNTKYGAWYGLNPAAWCAMFVSWVANQAGALDIIPRHAWTPSGARWFYDRGQWGTVPKPGAIVYFAWYGPTYQGRWKGICHVGIVEAVQSDGRVVCIEGNVSNMVKRVVRASYIAGYGYPKYLPEPAPAPKPTITDAYVTASGLNFRTGPSTNHKVIRVLTRGTKVQVIGSSGAWRNVIHSGTKGWVHGNYISTKAPAVPRATVTASGLNVRSGAGMKYRVIHVLRKGQVVEVLGRSGGWVRIRYGSVTGWSYGTYLKGV